MAAAQFLYALTIISVPLFPRPLLILREKEPLETSERR